MASANYGQTRSSQEATSQQNVWQTQVPYLQQLYEAGGEMAKAPAPAFDPGTYGAWQSALSGQINPTTGQVIADATKQMGLDFQQNVAPALRRSAVGSGAAGGGREAIAEGLAAGAEARAEAATRASMTDAALTAARGQQTAAIQAAPSLMTLQAALPWSNLQQFSQILGSPVVLGSSQSSGASSGYNIGASYGKK